MKIFKIAFANNRPISCKEITDGAVMDGSRHYTYADGKLIQAVVKVELEIEVLEMVAKMVDEVKRKRPVQMV